MWVSGGLPKMSMNFIVTLMVNGFTHHKPLTAKKFFEVLF